MPKIHLPLFNETHTANVTSIYNLLKSKVRKKRNLLILESPVFVETSVFVDRDLFDHMKVNFPVDTERELIRFVLAMINAVMLKKFF